MSNYIEYLKQQFPDLFENDEVLGNSDVPPGWENIVYNLCDSINYYINNTYRLHPNPALKARCRLYIYRKLICLESIICYRIIDPYRQFKTKKNGRYTISTEQQESVKNTIKYKLYTRVQRVFKKINKSPKIGYVKVTPPRVSVAQIKQKFGELRFYYDGGDDKVEGAVNFAENLCSKTCEETGKPGQLCVNRGWYRVLCEESAKQFNYKLAKR